MKIVLVNTLSYATPLASKGSESFLREFYLPLGLLTIAAMAEKLGHVVEIVDPNVIALNARMTSSSELHKISASEISSRAPDLVGFTTMCDSYHHTIAIARLVKATGSVPIIFGGPHASAVAGSTMKAIPEVDFILVGEVEASFPRFLAAFQSEVPFAEVPSLVFRDHDVVRENARAPLIPDIDAAPMPAIRHYGFLRDHIDFLPIEAGRGCPFHCDFCSTAVFFQRTYRLKSAQRIREEIRELEEVFGPKKIFRFIHDMLTVDKRAVGSLCTGLAQLDPIREWQCSARADCVTSDLLMKMHRAGCRDIYFGIESGSRAVQIETKKKLNLNKVFPRVHDAVSLGMNTTLSFICGFPNETLDDLDDTLAMILEGCIRFGSSAQFQLHLLAPYVGTELFEKHSGELLLDGYFSDQTGQPVGPSEIDLIQRYPELFSNFYYVPTKNYDRAILFGIDSFAYVVLQDFPLTAGILHRAGVRVLDIYLRWQVEAMGLLPPEQLAVVNGAISDIKLAAQLSFRKFAQELGPGLRRVFVATLEYELAVSIGEIASEPLQGLEQVTNTLTLLRSELDVQALKLSLGAGELDSRTVVGDSVNYVISRPTDRSVQIASVSAFLASYIRCYHEAMGNELVAHAKLRLQCEDIPETDFLAAVSRANEAARVRGYLTIRHT